MTPLSELKDAQSKVENVYADWQLKFSQISEGEARSQHGPHDEWVFAEAIRELENENRPKWRQIEPEVIQARGDAMKRLNTLQPGDPPHEKMTPREQENDNRAFDSAISDVDTPIDELLKANKEIPHDKFKGLKDYLATHIDKLKDYQDVLLPQ